MQWIEAPDPAHEVGAVLRRVKRLLLDGCAPDDILIALRDWPLYGGQVTAQGRDVRAAAGAALRRSAGAQSGGRRRCSICSACTAGDFRRRDLLDVLRSPYFAVPGLDTAQD